MLAAEYCRNLEGEAPLNPEGLMVVWSESDDGPCGITANCWR